MLRSRAEHGVSKHGGKRGVCSHPSRLAALAPQDEDRVRYGPTLTPIAASPTASTSRMMPIANSQRVVEVSDFARSSSDLWLMTKILFFEPLPGLPISP